MPVIESIILEPDMEGVLSRVPASGGQTGERVRELLLEILEEIRDEGLIRPRAAYREHLVSDAFEEGFCLEGGSVLRGRLLAETFAGARSLVAAACTIGPALEKKAGEHFREGRQLRGFLLDTAGSAAVDLLAAEVCRLIKRGITSGASISSPVSPGMPGFPLSAQAGLLSLAGAERIGVRLTSGGMLDPRKSLTMLMATGGVMPQWTPEEACSRCPMFARCPYRLRAATHEPLTERSE